MILRLVYDFEHFDYSGVDMVLIEAPCLVDALQRAKRLGYGVIDEWGDPTGWFPLIMGGGERPSPDDGEKFLLYRADGTVEEING